MMNIIGVGVKIAINKLHFESLREKRSLKISNQFGRQMTYRWRDNS